MGPPTWGPFFYLCNYHGDQDQSTLENGEIAISVSLAGNPEFYVPGNIYKGTFVSSFVNAVLYHSGILAEQD